MQSYTAQTVSSQSPRTTVLEWTGIYKCSHTNLFGFLDSLSVFRTHAEYSITFLPRSPNEGQNSASFDLRAIYLQLKNRHTKSERFATPPLVTITS